MTEKELLRHQIDDAGFQLDKVFESIEEASLDFRLTEHAMTPREILAHLCECYVATSVGTEGKEHEWGTYTAPDTTWPALFNNMKELRATAAEAALATPDYETKTSAFMIAHDFYHVGQMCMVRLVRDPSWNAYSIYNMG